jgi:hypothetical protein
VTSELHHCHYWSSVIKVRIWSSESRKNLQFWKLEVYETVDLLQVDSYYIDERLGSNFLLKLVLFARDKLMRYGVSRLVASACNETEMKLILTIEMRTPRVLNRHLTKMY